MRPLSTCMPYFEDFSEYVEPYLVTLHPQVAVVGETLKQEALLRMVSLMVHGLTAI